MHGYRPNPSLAYTISGVKKAYLYGIFTGGIGALAYCSMITVLWYGGRLVIAGKGHDF